MQPGIDRLLAGYVEVAGAGDHIQRQESTARFRRPGPRSPGLPHPGTPPPPRQVGGGEHDRIGHAVTAGPVSPFQSRSTPAPAGTEFISVAGVGRARRRGMLEPGAIRPACQRRAEPFAMHALTLMSWGFLALVESDARWATFQGFLKIQRTCSGGGEVWLGMRKGSGRSPIERFARISRASCPQAHLRRMAARRVAASLSGLLRAGGDRFKRCPAGPMWSAERSVGSYWWRSHGSCGCRKA